jgi:hypothetical protein
MASVNHLMKSLGVNMDAIIKFLFEEIKPAGNLDDAVANFKQWGSFPIIVEEYYASRFDTSRIDNAIFKGYDLEDGTEVKWAVRSKNKNGSIMVNSLTNKGIASRIAMLIHDPKKRQLFEIIITPKELMAALLLDHMPKYIIISDTFIEHNQGKINILLEY